MAKKRLDGTSKVARDITAQKHLEATLSLKSALIDLSEDAILAWDLDRGIIEWNMGSERLYGYSRDEAIGRVSHELLTTIHPVSMHAILERLSERHQWSGELRHHTR